MRPLSLLLSLLLAIFPEMLLCLLLPMTMQLPLEPTYVLASCSPPPPFLVPSVFFRLFDSTFRTIFLF